jgi:hypothetical protein
LVVTEFDRGIDYHRTGPEGENKNRSSTKPNRRRTVRIFVLLEVVDSRRKIYTNLLNGLLGGTKFAEHDAPKISVREI